MNNENTKERLGHWSDCAVHNEPGLPVAGCDCGGLDLTAYDRYRAVTSLIPTPGSLARFIQGGVVPSPIEVENAPRRGVAALASTPDLPSAHDGIACGAGPDRVDLHNPRETIVGDREPLSGVQRVTGNMPPHKAHSR